MKHTPEVQIAFPAVRIEAAASGALTVTIDGQAWSSPATPQPTTADLPELLGEISTDLAAAYRLELVAANGQVATDVITPDDIALSTHRRRPAANPMVFGVIGSGFDPGETVSVAVVVSTCIASDDGVAGLRLPPALLARKPRPLVLLGVKSHQVVVSDPAHAEAGAA